MSDIFTRSARNHGAADNRPIRIDGSVRSNLLAAIASVRRLRGKPVHADTITYWRRLVEYARRGSDHGESVTDLIADLESELPAARRSPAA